MKKRCKTKPFRFILYAIRLTWLPYYLFRKYFNYQKLSKLEKTRLIRTEPNLQLVVPLSLSNQLEGEQVGSIVCQPR